MNDIQASAPRAHEEKKPSAYRIALTKRAYVRQLMKAGSPKQSAESTSTKVTHEKRWQSLPLHVRAEIAWKCLTQDERGRNAKP